MPNRTRHSRYRLYVRLILPGRINAVTTALSTPVYVGLSRTHCELLLRRRCAWLWTSYRRQRWRNNTVHLTAGVRFSLLRLRHAERRRRALALDIALSPAVFVCFATNSGGLGRRSSSSFSRVVTAYFLVCGSDVDVTAHDYTQDIAYATPATDL